MDPDFTETSPLVPLALVPLAELLDDDWSVNDPLLDDMPAPEENDTEPPSIPEL